MTKIGLLQQHEIKSIPVSPMMIYLNKYAYAIFHYKFELFLTSINENID